MDLSGLLMAAGFCGVVAYALHRVHKHGSVGGAVMGAKVKKTLVEVRCAPLPIGKITLRVHVLESSPRDHEREVGVELRFMSLLAFQMNAVSLSREEARRMANALNDAADAAKAADGVKAKDQVQQIAWNKE